MHRKLITRQCKTSQRGSRSLNIENALIKQVTLKNQSLIRVSKELKGFKRKIKQQQKIQLLKQKHLNLSNNKKTVSLNATASRSQVHRTMNNTARSRTITPDVLENMKIKHQLQLFDYIQTRRQQSSRHSRERLKMFNHPNGQKDRISRILFNNNFGGKNSKELIKKPSTSPQKQFNPEMSLRQTLFNKELRGSKRKYGKDNGKDNGSRKKSPTTVMNQTVGSKGKQLMSYESENLNKRLNQYMNTLISKVEKDQMDLNSLTEQENKNQQFQYANKQQQQDHKKISQYFLIDHRLNYFRNMMKSTQKKMHKERQIQTTQRSATRQKSVQEFKKKNIKISLKQMFSDQNENKLVKDIIKNSLPLQKFKT